MILLNDIKNAYKIIKKNYFLTILFYFGVAYFVFFELFPLALDVSIWTGTIVLNLIFFFLLKSLFTFVIWIARGFGRAASSIQANLLRIRENFRVAPRNIYRYLTSFFF